MRLHRLALVAALSSFVLLASPASALESLDEVRCRCADSAANQGDYVSCIASFTRRLVLVGTIDRVERSNAIADASSEDLEALLAGCAADDNNLAVAGWGVGLQVGSAFYPDPAASGVDAVADLNLFLWNLAPDDVIQTTPVAPGGDCAYDVRVLDQFGNIVRRDDSICLPTTGRFDLPAGTIEQRAFPLPLLAFGAVTGLRDGARLPVGAYTIRVTWSANGPSETDMPSTAGAQPSASITIRIGS